MAFGPLFLGLLLLLWLALGLGGWLIATWHFRPRASFFALLMADVAALVGGVLPAVVGWRTAPALLCGLLRALGGSPRAAWHTMKRPGWPAALARSVRKRLIRPRGERRQQETPAIGAARHEGKGNGE